MNYRTYADLSTDILENINMLPKNLDLVVGIPRSGMIPAYIIGTQLNLAVLSLPEFLAGINPYKGRRNNAEVDFKPKRILIIDDSIDSGFAINNARTEVQTSKIEGNIYYGAIYSSHDDTNEIDFYIKKLPQPRFFQWNYKNHFIATKACYDIDGVLCMDPTDEENDDGEKYVDFILNAKPLYVPNKKISCLVTSRLEKYRKETEKWLIRNNILYDNLIMMDLETAEKRRKLGNHAIFKAGKYKERSEELFVESDWKQAKTIFEISNKPVICTANDTLIKSYADIVFYENQTAKSLRPLQDIFSDASEIGLKYHELFKQFENLRIENEKVKTRLYKVKNNKWYKFSKLSRFNKILKFHKLIYNC